MNQFDKLADGGVFGAMGLQAYTLDLEIDANTGFCDEPYPEACGFWYRRSDVDAMLAEIRAVCEDEGYTEQSYADRILAILDLGLDTGSEA